MRGFVVRYALTAACIFGSVLGACAQTDGEGATLRDSLSLLRRQVDRYPDSIPLRYAKASLNMRLEQWRYAQDEYTEILRRRKDAAEALYFRAHAYDQQGLYGLARADYQRFLVLEPGNVHGMVGLALTSKKQGRKAEAVEWLDRAIAANPDKAVAYAMRGNMELDAGKLELAEYDFAKASELEPENTDYLLLRTEVLLRMKRKTDARECLRRLIQLGIEPSALEEFAKRCK